MSHNNFFLLVTLSSLQQHSYIIGGRQCFECEVSASVEPAIYIYFCLQFSLLPDLVQTHPPIPTTLVELSANNQAEQEFEASLGEVQRRVEKRKVH